MSKKKTDMQKWAQFAAGIKEKRKRKDKVSTSLGSEILVENEMIVQRLDSQPSGKAMKYERIGAQEFVAYPYPEVDLDLIKKSCYDHFKYQLIDPTNSRCDVLASQNGPSCSKLSHIKTFKLIFVRFVCGKPQPPMTDCDSMSVLGSLGLPEKLSSKSLTLPSKRKTSFHRPTSNSSTTQSSKQNTNEKDATHSAYPKSISISTMLRVGTAISYKIQKPINIKLLEFNVEKLEWNPFYQMKQIIIEEKPFARGGFRKVFKAQTTSGEKFVIKRFLGETLDTMNKVNEVLKKGETFESLARKAIQTHMLALNFTAQLRMFISNTCAAEYGKTFLYEKAYLGIIEKDGEENEHVMVEPFISGEFKKYLNNNGSPIRKNPEDFELVQKAVCLAHYSYEKSDEKLLLLDIQGSNFVLYDPEIATKDNAIDESCGLKILHGKSVS